MSGSGCSCGSDCFSESATTETIIAGFAPVQMFYERSEMNFGAENGCKCGSNCT
ncbi:hypothetical protein DKX38_029802 [Salix brachista]|uniref:Metallothionein-like protein n=1 Tax=Salix brachista TaxID=2182728 RepID=A0A5N5J4D0_9ROSI|nr:hypothetical protein DKX38_029802 [Salix brachista]